MQKRGQLYFVAALIIVVLIIGLGAVYNYANSSQEDKSVFDLSEEIDYETSRVIDRGVFAGETIEAQNNQINQIVEYYSNRNPNSELVTLIGNTTQITSYHYRLDEEGAICIQTGACSGLQFFTKERISPSVIHDVSNNLVTVRLEEGTSYKFELKQGQNFYIVLIKTKEGEKFVASPERKN